MNFHDLTLCLALTVAATAGCSARESMDRGRADACLPVIVDYVKSTRGWPEGAYDIVPEGERLDLIGYAVMHRTDRNKLPSEALTSFHVDLDSKCKAVVGELGYQ